MTSTPVEVLHCAKCGKPTLTGPCLDVGDRTWHKDCFECSDCSRALVCPDYYEYDNLPFCFFCYGCKFDEKTCVSVNPRLIRYDSVPRETDQRRHPQTFTPTLRNSTIRYQ